MNSKVKAPTRMKSLLSVIELGGYPNFDALYRSAGYDVHSVNTVRNAIRHMKTSEPAVVVAEFNFQSDFRDRTSSLESLLSTTQRFLECRIIVFYEQEFSHQLERLTAQFKIDAALAFPVDENQLRACLEKFSGIAP